MNEEKYLRISEKKIPGLVLLWILLIIISRAGYEAAGIFMVLGIVGYIIKEAE